MPSAEPAPAALSDALLAELSGFITAHLGLRCLPGNWNALARGIEDLSSQLSFADAVECAHWLLKTKPTRQHLEIAGRHLLISESYFFREPATFEVLRRQILPELLRPQAASGQGGRSLRIWSAGCATGEEPYSLAMLLDQIMPNAADRDVALLGTDILSDVLETAVKGGYRDWSFRGVPQEIRERYFRPREPNCYELDPRIRGRVTFAPLCLTTDPYPSGPNGAGAFDLILCRNVLMYLDPGHARRVVQRLSDALADGGWLIIGVTETSLPLFDGLETARRFPAVYRKRSKSHSEQPSVPRPAARPWPARRPVKRRPKAAAPAVRSTSAAEWHRLAVWLARSGRVDDAIGAAAQCLSQSPNDAAVLVLLARLRADRGALDAALDYAQRATAAGKSDASAHYQHACILNELSRRSEAASALRRVVYLQPEFALAHYMLGVIAHADGETAAACRHLDNALAILARRDPDEELHEAKGLTVGSLAAIVGSLRDSTAARTMAAMPNLQGCV